MNTVKDLVEQIISYSHDEDTPETNLMEKALVWLNSAYHEMLQENLIYLKHKMIKYESKTVTDSTFDLPEDFYSLEKIILDNSMVISKYDKALYDIELGEIYLSSDMAKLAEIAYIPQFKDLTFDDLLTSLHIDSNHAKNLIWGALVWSSIYERGLHTQSELSLFETKWTQTKQNLKMTLSSYSNEVLRTSPYRFLN
ncbi:MAG: hypothetical protein GY793_07760 [Proteobacteria bacterium]|nr:hypothetical protein [Pseudomonadota bacterium]